MAPDYLVEHMLIPVSGEEPAASKQSKLRYAADLVARVREGEIFAQVRATARQAAVFEIGGTEFGWRKAEQLPTLFREVVEGMGIGDVEGPIEAGNGFHLIQLANKAGGAEQMVAQTNFRHIMLTPNEIRDEQQTEVGAVDQSVTIKVAGNIAGAFFIGDGERRAERRVSILSTRYLPHRPKFCHRGRHHPAEVLAAINPSLHVDRQSVTREDVGSVFVDDGRPTRRRREVAARI